MLGLFKEQEPGGVAGGRGTWWLVGSGAVVGIVETRRVEAQMTWEFSRQWERLWILFWVTQETTGGSEQVST